MKRRDREAWELQDPAHVAAMTTEAIQRQLRDLGIDGSREAFLPLTEGRTSAWEVSERWIGQLVLPRNAEVFAGLAAHQIWRRVCPERPSIEAFEDEMQEGYDLDTEGDAVGACEAWSRAWAMLRSWLRPEHRTCSSADSVARSREALYNWTQDYGMVCVPAAVRDPAWAARGVEYHEQILEQFPDEGGLYRINMLADLAELLERAGQKERAERTARDLIEEHPGSGAGYCRLAELLEWRGDRAQALAVLKAARERMEDEPEDWSLDERIEHLEGPPDGEAGVDPGRGPMCERPGCFAPPRPGSRFCGSECEYAVGVVERRERR